MEVTFEGGKLTECKVSNPDELYYLNNMLIRTDFTGTLKYEFTDPRGDELETACNDMYEELLEEGKDPAKDREFMRLVCELSRVRKPLAYYGPERFNGLHHDGKRMPYLFADYHSRALAEVVSSGQQDREDCLYDAFCKSVKAYKEYFDGLIEHTFKNHINEGGQ